ncbi:flagellar assembly protein FliH [Campylobacter curvus]|uniref:flagellar assembly protein FliH n=1 Tax=Campylobacter curvus TaxID=200 RepID=UPI00146FE8AB|nr:flagellar assembly protein FliH [Campylobacter curvus]
MKSSVINGENSLAHFIENYRFKVLGSDQRAEQISTQKSDENGEDIQHENIKQEPKISPNLQNQMPSSQPQSQNHGGFDSNFVEELLKKTDELSGNIIKLQMQIENQESEFNKRLEAEVARAKEDGKNEGLAQANEAYEAQVKELEARFSSSVQKLSDQYDKFDEFLKKSEDELGGTAINIAKEVISKEISANSSVIAHTLASSLVRDLGDAKNIQIKVNPSDSEYLTAQFAKNDHIKISPDDAISKGGVVIISEGGNIDATIETRLEKLKSLVGE